MTKAYAAGERGANAAEGRVPCAQPQTPCQSSAFASWIWLLCHWAIFGGADSFPPDLTSVKEQHHLFYLLNSFRVWVQNGGDSSPLG